MISKDALMATEKNVFELSKSSYWYNILQDADVK